MSINQLKIVVSILKEVSEDNTPTAYDYGITKEKYYDIIQAMQDDGLIKGVNLLAAGNRIIANNSHIKITIRGMEYLYENSALMKTYKGLKEVREWLPF